MFNRVLVVAALCCAGFTGGFLFLGGGAAEESPPTAAVVEQVGIPNLCEQAATSVTMRTEGTGHSLSSHKDAFDAEVNEAGTCDVNFVTKEHSPLLEVRFYWDGEEVITVPGPSVVGLGHIYTFVFNLDTEGTPKVHIEDPKRQLHWYGEDIGYHTLTEGDAFFSPECIAAGKDPAYGYAPGTGPACVAHTYQKQCKIDPETNEEHCPVVVVD